MARRQQAWTAPDIHVVDSTNSGRCSSKAVISISSGVAIPPDRTMAIAS